MMKSSVIPQPISSIIYLQRDRQAPLLTATGVGYAFSSLWAVFAGMLGIPLNKRVTRNLKMWHNSMSKSIALSPQRVDLINTR